MTEKLEKHLSALKSKHAELDMLIAEEENGRNPMICKFKNIRNKN